MGTTTLAPVLTGVTPVAFGLWATPVGGSAWVGCSPTSGNILGFGCTANCGAPPGFYLYELAIAPLPGAGILQFAWAADNAAQITVSQGSSLLYSAAFGGGPAVLTNVGPISFGAGTPVFIRGLVRNDEVAPGDPTRSPHGWLVTGTASDATPEPSTFALFGLAAAAGGAVLRRRRRQPHA